jgi:putative hydrolases of HD superfamily
VNKEFLEKLFSAYYMQRWNDKLRPMEFIEFDKQAHKMVIAYFLGKFEEHQLGFDWGEIIEGGIFDFLQRLIITDIKPTILQKITENPKQHKEFNDWIYKQLEPFIVPLGKNLCERYKAFYENDNENINKKILAAAHWYSSKWEFDIIERANPDGYDVDFIKRDFNEKMEHFYDLEGIKQLALYNSYKKFIDLCGQLRFQIRWANLHRIPKTSVLGHSLFVAISSYLLSLQINAGKKRCYNNYFTGLFHDLPEVLTRDIISPVKRSIEGLSDLIKIYEKEQMDLIVYPIIPKMIHGEISLFAEEEFDNVVFINGKKISVKAGEISEKYADDKFNARDGDLVKGVDELSAFIEAKAAIENGSHTGEFFRAIRVLKEKYIKLDNVAGISFKKIYEEFD